MERVYYPKRTRVMTFRVTQEEYELLIEEAMMQARTASSLLYAITRDYLDAAHERKLARAREAHRVALIGK